MDFGTHGRSSLWRRYYKNVIAKYAYMTLVSLWLQRYSSRKDTSLNDSAHAHSIKKKSNNLHINFCVHFFNKDVYSLARTFWTALAEWTNQIKIIHLSEAYIYVTYVWPLRAQKLWLESSCNISISLIKHNWLFFVWNALRVFRKSAADLEYHLHLAAQSNS